MFEYCADPKTLEGLTWLSCYLTTPKHMEFYRAFITVLSLLVITAPVALAFGFGGAVASRSPNMFLRALGNIYTGMVRGIPDIVFFLFFVIALDQGIEWITHQVRCPDWTDPIRQGLEFKVCPQAKVPAHDASPFVHTSYAFALAVLTFAIVFGAFAANVLSGAMKAVPQPQIETAQAYGMSRRQTFWRILVPQMWVYALPGLSNLWLILIKATPLLFLLGIQDIVYWAKEMGASKSPRFDYPHPNWQLWYFLALLVFYLALTRVSEIALAKLARRLNKGQATRSGETLRKAQA